MITQEEIPYTKEECKAMVKTIDQLRREKRELLDNICDWLKENLIYSSKPPYQIIEDLRKAFQE